LTNVRMMLYYMYSKENKLTKGRAKYAEH